MCMVAVKDVLLKEAQEYYPEYSQTQIVENALSLYLVKSREEKARRRAKQHFLDAIGKISFDSAAAEKLREDSIV